MVTWRIIQNIRKKCLFPSVTTLAQMSRLQMGPGIVLGCAETPTVQHIPLTVLRPLGVCSVTSSNPWALGHYGAKTFKSWHMIFRFLPLFWPLENHGVRWSALSWSGLECYVITLPMGVSWGPRRTPNLHLNLLEWEINLYGIKPLRFQG